MANGVEAAQERFRVRDLRNVSPELVCEPADIARGVRTEKGQEAVDVRGVLDSPPAIDLDCLEYAENLSKPGPRRKLTEL
jgi:hypothetical protein